MERERERERERLDARGVRAIGKRVTAGASQYEINQCGLPTDSLGYQTDLLEATASGQSKHSMVPLVSRMQGALNNVDVDSLSLTHAGCQMGGWVMLSWGSV